MADEVLVGRNYRTPDLVAKVTGRARYAEDFRVDGMLFAKLLLSPMPHARVRHVDASAALAMEGVEGILTADDLPARRSPTEEQALTMEPVYEGEPILAVAAVDEATAAEAIERIVLDLEPLPFVVDPLDSLRPGSPNARLEGNVAVGDEAAVETVKWIDANFAEAAKGRLPMGESTDVWGFGDVDAGLAEADVVIDETVVLHSTSHQPLETRSAMAYWQNGTCYLHASTQSLVRSHGPAAERIGVDPSKLVYIGEYAGGAFGSKGQGSISECIPALLARKTGKPVMMRIARREEHAIGRARPGFQARVRLGCRRDGRITAIDIFVVQDNGPYGRRADFRNVGRYASLAYQPSSIRLRGLSVLTNTPPRGAQRAPGGFQMTAMIEPVIASAARRLGIDQIELRRINAPAGRATYDVPGGDGTRPHITGAFVREALDRARELFRWDERQARRGRRRGGKVTGVGVGLGVYGSGSVGYDGLLTIRPDGKLYVQSGCGNLGTHSVFDTTRIAPQLLGIPWEKVEIAWGGSSRRLPWSSSQGGSQTTHAHTRANLAAAEDAKRKLQEIAARDLGGSPDDYDVGGERVFRRANRSRHLTLAQAARRAIQLGGRYDGHQLPDDIDPWTVAAAQGLAGVGLMGVAKDSFGHDGNTYSFVVGLAEVEVDVETGRIVLVDYAAVADCGTVLHPRSLGAQITGGGVQGIGCALSQKWVFDKHWGIGVARRFYSNRPPSILDVPASMSWAAVGIPDPQTPVGSKGVGEPAMGAGAAAVRCAITDAVGEACAARMPTSADMVLTSLELDPETLHDLTAHV